MISLDEARELLLAGVGVLASERVAIGEAAGRVLAADVVAPRDQPPSAVSAMDGYAVVAAAVGDTLRVIGEAPAGAPFAGVVGPGEAVRIATGGVVPEGATLVVIQEHVECQGDGIMVRELSQANHVRPTGGDFRNGAVVAIAGDVLTPGRIALVAATGVAGVAVVRRPRVAIIASGDELRAPGSRDVGAIFDSGGPAIAALVEAWGGKPVRLPILPDDRVALDAALAGADLDVDVIVTLGGASVGHRDQLRPAFVGLGAVIAFDRVAVIPGKPTWHARFGDGRLLVGLPGNPASAFVCAHLFVAPLLAALTGRDPGLRLEVARLGQAIGANGLREAWLRGRVAVDDEGRRIVSVDARQDSSLTTPLAAANVLVRRLPDSPALGVGDKVETLAIGAF
ncbi:molybdopterin molybdotransferase MoeA [Sphingomonas sp. RB1R13]|uniref:molybdopterin molybdotransferase MoeA n=1 Tax=Sphingomonas sp. RB1R13 TaxID=3096159 RepID=UPI002FC83E98